MSIVERAMWVMVALLACLTLAALSGCDQPRCKDGDQNIQSTGDVFLCVDGEWVRQDNPNPDPIEALGERILVVR